MTNAAQFAKKGVAQSFLANSDIHKMRTFNGVPSAPLKAPEFRQFCPKPLHLNKAKWYCSVRIKVRTEPIILGLFVFGHIQIGRKEELK